MQVLTQELNRVNEQLSQLSFYKDKLTTLISAHETVVTTPSVSVTVERTPKKSRGRKNPVLPQMLVNRIADYVAGQVSINGYTKAQAINDAMIKFKIPNTDAMKKRLSSSLAPSAMGKDKYNELFKGTKYVVD